MAVSRSILKGAALGVALAFGMAHVAHANVWLDEDFESEDIFEQNNGEYVAGQTGWDIANESPTFSPITSTTGYNQDGARVTTKAFRGDASLLLEGGDDITVGPDYTGVTNGSLQVFQFAVNVDPIPAAGTVAEFRWNHDTNTAEAEEGEYSLYVRLESTGSAVDIIAGEDLVNASDPPEETIGTLTSASGWAFISVVVQKDPATADDDRISEPASFDQGIYFFNSSSTPAHFIELGGPGDAYNSRGWSFTVTSGGVYLDEMYWEGGKEDQPADSNLRPFTLIHEDESNIGTWIQYD